MRITALILCCSLLTPLAHGKDIDGEFAVFGLGGKTCRDYKSAYTEKGQTLLGYSDWLEGYLSAFNLIVINTYDIMAARKLDKAMAWLFKYCDKEPQETFVNAVAALTVRLYPSRKNLAPGKDNAQKWQESGSLVKPE